MEQNRPPNRMVSMQISKIAGLIYVVRGQKVLLDADLAALYGVSTGRLNEQVRRNIGRFPGDFMFQLRPVEQRNLLSQIAIASSRWGGKRNLALVFTQEGVAMLSSVLGSERAIRVNIEIMRTFVRMRSALLARMELDERIHKIERTQVSHEREIGEQAVQIHEVFAAMRDMAGPRCKRRERGA